MDALNHYEILDSAPEAAFDSIASLAALVLGTQSASISFIDDRRQWFKARCRIEQCETPIAVSFCAHTIESSTIFVVEDASRDPRFATNPFVAEAPNIRFYAGMRILATDGTAIGSLCAFDPEPRPQGLTKVQKTTLRVLASQVESLLELRRAIIEREAQVATQSQLSEKLRHVAQHDVLTGLPHREMFRKRIVAAMRDAERKNTRVALMLVDVDHFKQINDSLGHDAGDALLCNFADRLRALVRGTDIVARLGGDEFGLLLSGIDRDEDVEAIIRSLNDRLNQPMEHHGRVVDCRASTGLAIFPDHATTLEKLVKCSDLALAAAKRTRGCVETFFPSMAEEFEREAQILSIAREAATSGSIVAHYQPKIGLSSGTLVGFEALVRCDRPSLAPILPEFFGLPFADHELTLAISRQMLACVLDDIRRWVDRGLDFGHVAINTGAADFHGNDFAERLLAEIETRGLKPSMIELEVTEGVFLGRGSHHVARALSVLSEYGVRIALDDFGTGYAALTHLKQFRVDVLKIDRSFVSGIGENVDDTAIVRALIALGESLGIETVAEGIETQAVNRRPKGTPDRRAKGTPPRRGDRLMLSASF
ncbi:sensor domain-containing phosphodiesterase, partial [Sphingosinicella soli]